eukprot:Nitzschia sp. Nitz4//scaffold513_size4213//290//2075//NITZ4_009252-RA/size4213-augustus-gene-0.3-mRNA-1//1//CDS//3329553786//737//frame0
MDIQQEVPTSSGANMTPNTRRRTATRKAGGSQRTTLLIFLVLFFMSCLSMLQHSVHIGMAGSNRRQQGGASGAGGGTVHEALRAFKKGNPNIHQGTPSEAFSPRSPTKKPKSPEGMDQPDQPEQQRSQQIQRIRSEYQDDDDPNLLDQSDQAPIPNPPLPDGNTTFSACLLVMDDNHRLVEWLAYHYHVLPLRYLIIAVDPRSRTSPVPVLNAWRRMGMFVRQWQDMDFMREDLAQHPVTDHDELHVKRDRHRMRQKVFYQQCLQQAKDDDRTWVSLIDTDEFLTYNHKGGAAYQQWEKRQQKLHKRSVNWEQKRIRPSQTPPTTADPGALLPYIRQEAAAGRQFFNRSCISCPRLLFVAKESTLEEREKDVPKNASLHAHRLDTLRYRVHAERQDFVKNGLSKSLLDVSRIDTFPRIQTLHRPIKTICPAPWRNEWDSGLRINHYLGSWEAYSFRDDSRRGGERSFEAWAFKAQDADETDDNIRPWVGGFVQEHGPTKAKQLLKGSGLPRGYLPISQKNWTFSFVDKILSSNQTDGNNPSQIAFDNFVRDYHLFHNRTAEGIV